MVDTSVGREIIKTLTNAGIAQGRLLVLSELFQRRLGRPLTDAENSTLTARFHALGHERLSAVVLDLGATALAAWLADPSAD